MISLILKKTNEATNRFILPVICSLLFYMVTILPESSFGYKEKWLVILSCICFWFIALKLYAESKQWSSGKYYAIGLPVSVLIAAHLYTAQSFFLVFAFLSPGLFLLILIAPFINKACTGKEIAWFQYHLSAQLCLTFLLAIILCLVTVFVFYSIDLLFDLKISDNIRYVLLLIVTFVASFTALSGIPNRYDSAPNDSPKFFHSIVNYILLPFVLAYTVILYAYTFKILITWELPKGGVAYLVIIFGTVGITTYLLSTLFLKITGIFLFFTQHFFKILLIPILLLTTAIGVRVYEFGITESRYLILLLLIWFVLCATFSFLIKKEKVYQCIFTSIVLLLMIASLPGLGAVPISEWSQIHRLKNILLHNNLLVEGKIYPLKSSHEIDNQIVSNISAILDYLINSQKTQTLKQWFKEMPNARINESPGSFTTSQILEEMGLSAENTHDTQP